MKTKLRIVSVLLAAMLLLLCACGGNGETSASGQPAAAPGSAATPAEDPAAPEAQDKALDIGVVTDITAFGPGGNRTERYQCKMVFESLLSYDPVSGEYQPMLAKSYEYLDDLTLKFTLRDDVYFTNGHHMTAEDVLYSLKEVWATGTMESYFDCNDWENSYVEDDYTLILKYNKEYGPSVSLFCQWYIYDKDWCATATEEDWFSNPVGTGPYTVKETAAGSHITFVRKPADQYWGELPECEEATYHYYAESSTMFVDLETGKLDAAVGVNSTDAARVLDGGLGDGYGYSVNPLKDCLNLILPENREVWQDIRVREAFMCSLDTEAIAEATYGVLYQNATSTLPASVLYYEQQENYTYDIEHAKALLEEAGYGGKVIDLRLVVTPGQDTLAEALQACASQSGFNISIEVYDPTVAVPYMRDGEVDLMLKETPGGAYLNDPCMLYDNLSPTSFLAAARQTTDEWVSSFEMGLYSNDPEQRAKGYAACQEYLHDQYRATGICERVNMIVWNKTSIAEFQVDVADEPTVYKVCFA